MRYIFLNAAMYLVKQDRLLPKCSTVWHYTTESEGEDMNVEK